MTHLEPQLPLGSVAVSVIIPSINADQFIGAAVDSALANKSSVQVVVQDGGSTDQTLDVLAKFGARISVDSAPDSGQSQALNRALARSQGEFVGWLNADDFYTRGALDRVVQIIEEDPEIDLVYGDYALVREDGEQLRRYFVQPLSQSRIYDEGCYVWSGATFIRRTLLQQVGGFDETLNYCMDLDLFLKLSPLVRSVHVPEVLGSFRIHSRSKSGGVPWKFVTEAHSVRRRHSDGSVRSKLMTWKADLTTTLYLATRRIWLSDQWASIRRSKRR